MTEFEFSDYEAAEETLIEPEAVEAVPTPDSKNTVKVKNVKPFENHLVEDANGVFYFIQEYQMKNTYGWYNVAEHMLSEAYSWENEIAQISLTERELRLSLIKQYGNEPELFNAEQFVKRLNKRAIVPVRSN